MQIEKIQYDDIKKGDFIVRIARHNKEIFTQSGVASHQDDLEMPYGITRRFWYSDEGSTLAYVDIDGQEDMEHFPEGWEHLQRVTI